MTARRPDHLKILTGTERADRAAPEPRITLAPLEDVPAAPDYLPNGHAVAEWNRLAPVLVANKLLTAGNLQGLAVLCGLQGRIVQLWTAGEAPQAALIAQYRALLADFGLLGMMKLPKCDAAPRENRFAQHGRRPDPKPKGETQ